MWLKDATLVVDKMYNKYIVFGFIRQILHFPFSKIYGKPPFLGLVIVRTRLWCVRIAYRIGAVVVSRLCPENIDARVLSLSLSLSLFC